MSKQDELQISPPSADYPFRVGDLIQNTGAVVGHFVSSLPSKNSPNFAKNLYFATPKIDFVAKNMFIVLWAAELTVNYTKSWYTKRVWVTEVFCGDGRIAYILASNDIFKKNFMLISRPEADHV